MNTCMMTGSPRQLVVGESEAPTMDLTPPSIGEAALPTKQVLRRSLPEPADISSVSFAQVNTPAQSQVRLTTLESFQDEFNSPCMRERSLAAFGSALKVIEEGLFIGDLGCMLSMEWQKEGIQAIVTIMPSVPQEVQDVADACPTLKHFHYALDDHIEYGDKERHNVSTLFSESPHKNIFDVLEFMHAARQQGQSVMVHCEQGKRRSATVMAAYLIWYTKRSRKDCIQLIQSRRRGATIPGIWRDELEFLAERRAAMEEDLHLDNAQLSRVLSTPDLRMQLAEELKERVLELKLAGGPTVSDEDPPSLPGSLESTP